MISSCHMLCAALFLAMLPACALTKGKTIVCLGDSLTRGYHIASSEAYPSRLQEYIRGAGLSYTVVNAGVSGDRTSDGLHRLDRLLRKNHVDIMILALGFNDAYNDVPVEEIRNNLQTIIDRVRTAYPDARIVLAGIRLPPESVSVYASSFAALYPQLADKNNLPLIPYFLDGVAGRPELNLADGIHPNAAGHRIMASTVWHTLEPLLK